MKSLLLLIITAVGIISFLLISATAPFKQQLKMLFPKESSFAIYTPSNTEVQLVALINNERQKNGLNNVQMIVELSTSAQNHNNTMQSCSLQFGVDACLLHQVTQLNEPNFGQRIKNTGYNFSEAKEIIGRGYATPTLMVNGWMNSSEHRATILDGTVFDIGCSFLNGGDTSHFWWTCDFGKFLNGQRTLATSSSTPPASPIFTPTPTILPTKSPTLSPRPTTTPTSSPTPTPNPVGILPGDIDGNRKVDIFDYNILVTNFGKSGSGIQGDLDNNGVVNIFDYNILVTNFGKTG